MDPEVSQLVDYVWAEASGQLEEVLAVPMETIKTEQVEKAEAALLSLKRCLMKTTDTVDPESDRADFYGNLPHKAPHKTAIDSVRTIAQKQDLCQVSWCPLRPYI